MNNLNTYSSFQKILKILETILRLVLWILIFAKARFEKALGQSANSRLN